MAMGGWHWGWVPAPRLRGGKLSTRGHGRGDYSFQGASFFSVVETKGGLKEGEREEGGEEDGSPHPRGQEGRFMGGW